MKKKNLDARLKGDRRKSQTQVKQQHLIIFFWLKLHRNWNGIDMVIMDIITNEC